jgi:hypothetical protein
MDSVKRPRTGPKVDGGAVWQDDTRRVSEEVHSKEISIFEPLIKAVPFSVITYDDAGSVNNSSSNVNHLITPEAIYHNHIECVARFCAQYLIHGIDTREWATDLHQMQLNVLRHFAPQFFKPCLISL